MPDPRQRHLDPLYPVYPEKKAPLGYEHHAPPRPRPRPHEPPDLSDLRSAADRQAEAMIADQLARAFKETLELRGTVTIESGYAYISREDWVAHDIPRIAGRVLRAFTEANRLVRVGMAHATREGRHASLITIWGRGP